jgi:Ca2+-binding RTX toxin-like protein
MATINGSNGDDILNGTPENDTITGFGGADQINGGDGSDVIAGGASTDSNPPDQNLDGADRIDGGRGDDVLRGGNGDDVLLGQQGEDNLRGDLGNDTLDGGENLEFGFDFEIDTVSYRFDDIATNTGFTLDASSAVSSQPVTIADGRGGVDTLIGIERVLLTGSAFNDTLTGSAGPDQIDGRGGDDVLRGGDFQDVLIGGAGNDIVFGEGGTDTFLVNAATDGADAVDLGGGGRDEVVVSSAGGGQVRLTFTSSAVGNGSVVDPTSTPPQDGGLAVRFQLEDSGGGLTGPVSRYEDEDILFTATTPGLTFDVRDLVSGAARGDQFRYVYLGSEIDDRFDLVFNANQSAYANGGGGTIS